MQYLAFKESIRSYLIAKPEGATWKELKEALNLPYKTPCPTWVNKLEAEISLVRERGVERALIWKLGDN